MAIRAECQNYGISPSQHDPANRHIFAQTQLYVNTRLYIHMHIYVYHLAESPIMWKGHDISVCTCKGMQRFEKPNLTRFYSIDLLTAYVLLFTFFYVFP